MNLKILFKVLQKWWKNASIFLSTFFGHMGKPLDKVRFKIFDVTAWETNNYSTNIFQHLTK